MNDILQLLIAFTILGYLTANIDVAIYAVVHVICAIAFGTLGLALKWLLAHIRRRIRR
jgi:hypothetical protein